jgi:hypothetical protein
LWSGGWWLEIRASPQEQNSQVGFDAVDKPKDERESFLV